jgi:hypothetical protein
MVRRREPRRFALMICADEQRRRVTAFVFPQQRRGFSRAAWPGGDSARWGYAVELICDGAGSLLMARASSLWDGDRPLTACIRPIIVRAMYGFRIVFGICRGIIS